MLKRVENCAYCKNYTNIFNCFVIKKYNSYNILLFTEALLIQKS